MYNKKATSLNEQSGSNSINPVSSNANESFKEKSQKMSLKYQQEYQDFLNENFKVVVRVRPPLPRELRDDNFVSTIQVSSDHKQICLYEFFLDQIDSNALHEIANNTNYYCPHPYSFDFVYDQDSTQLEVYETTAKAAVLSVLEGFNATLMAYGQTGTGKTYTMEGFKYNNVDPQRGIVSRAAEEIFKYIENCSDKNTTFMVRASYLQIYNDQISDLLRMDRTNLQIREDKKKGIFVENLSEWAIRNPQEVFKLIQKGANIRATASTKLNSISSRSHAVFMIIIEQMQFDSQKQDFKHAKVGKLNLVDLAGSERARVTGATGVRLEECKKINQSLSSLGNVISALTEPGNRSHIPYRDSKITRILEDSLGGNCKTTFMAMVSPAIDAIQESLSTLKFANRAKNIKNAPVINEDLDQRTLLKKYEIELKKLRVQLEEKNKGLFDKSHLLQLEREKKRAEEDKEMAMQALERKSREFFHEREEKKRLEEKIRLMNSQLLIGGQKIEETVQFRNALEEEQKKIRSQYEDRLKELEKERTQIEQDKAQVDKYKQLLLKQRDIMIALTNRLNERDENILQLQEELDAYDRIHKETEDALELKRKRVLFLEKFIQENNLSLPTKEIILEKHDSSAINNNIFNENLVLDFEEEENKDNREIQQKFSSSEMNKYKSEIETLKNKQHEYYELLEKTKELQEELDYEKQKSHSFMIELKDTQEKLKEKSLEINRLSFSNKVSPVKSPTKGLKVNILEEIKLNLDAIIENLSKPNDSKNLLKVSKDLLSLQDYVTLHLKNHDDKINFLISDKKKELSNNSSKSHKHSPSTNISYNIINTEPSDFKPSNFNIYKSSANY